MNNILSDIETQLLVMDAQAGSAHAMETLVRGYQKRLWRHAYRLTQNTDAAWDITQQAWLGIIKGLRKLNDPACFRAWAYRITTNKAVNWINDTRKRAHSHVEDIEDRVRKNNQDIGLVDLFRRLDEKKQAVLSLYYFEDLSIAEISMILNIPPGTVKSRLHNARQELKGLWEEYNNY